jgi:hypothetical protein
MRDGAITFWSLDLGICEVNETQKLGGKREGKQPGAYFMACRGQVHGLPNVDKVS